MPSAARKGEFPWETVIFLSVVLVIAAGGISLMTADLSRSGWSLPSVLLWLLFSILFTHLAFGFSHSLFGFALRRISRSRSKLDTQPSAPPPDLEEARVALLIPIYNEPVERVFANARAVFASVSSLPGGEAYDLYLLSDSDQPDQWIAEEAAWFDWTRTLPGPKRIFYRRRSLNRGRKSGNIENFCRSWGGGYRYGIILDADSVMSGTTLLELRLRMEANPRLALLQTAPALIGAETCFGKMQQFANHLYSPIYLSGLAWWQQECGNYWGHNAILRLSPFMEHCALPELPGRKPFGGPILSHDFVEAGLLGRAGWEVKLAEDLRGSYEEGPQSLIESAIRDRRWCQGNMQHAMLLTAPGFLWRTRLHLTSGIFAYLSSPLWLLFLLVGIWRSYTDAELSAPFFGWGILLLTAIMLLGPKLLALLDLCCDPERRRGFGGWIKASLGVAVETIFSTLLAPVLMLFHTRFVIWNLLGRSVNWTTQRRGANKTPWREALSFHGGQTVLGIALAIVTAFTNFPLFLWLSPILIGLILAIPISIGSSHPIRRPCHEHLLTIPDETLPSPELATAALETARLETSCVAKLVTPGRGIAAVITDPGLNAMHISLLGDTGPSVKSARTEAERLLRDGPTALSREEQIAVLSDVESLHWIHREIWHRADDDAVSPFWRNS